MYLGITSLCALHVNSVQQHVRTRAKHGMARLCRLLISTSLPSLRSHPCSPSLPYTASTAHPCQASVLPKDPKKSVKRAFAATLHRPPGAGAVRAPHVVDEAVLAHERVDHVLHLVPAAGSSRGRGECVGDGVARHNGRRDTSGAEEAVRRVRAVRVRSTGRGTVHRHSRRARRARREAARRRRRGER